MVGCPHVCAPPVCLYAPIHLYAPICPQGCTHPPWAPMLSVLLHGFGALYVVGGLFFCLMCIGAHHPYLGVPPPYYPPTLLCWLPVHCYSQGYQFLCGGLSPSIEGFGGVSPITWGGLGGTSALCCSHVHSYTFFVVHYVSRLDHGSDYYSSSYCGIFWPVISVSGSFPNRVSRKPWCGSTTTLDAEELWKCSWLRFCAAAAYSIFNASSGLCQLCYGFSTGRFLFQS